MSRQSSLNWFPTSVSEHPRSSGANRRRQANCSFLRHFRESTDSHVLAAGLRSSKRTKLHSPLARLVQLSTQVRARDGSQRGNQVESRQRNHRQCYRIFRECERSQLPVKVPGRQVSRGSSSKVRRWPQCCTPHGSIVSRASG